MGEVDSCDLTALHDAMVAAIKEQFPDVKTVKDYPRIDEHDGEKLQLPAIFIEVSQMEPSDDVGNNGNDGTEQLGLRLQFEARCVVGFKGTRQAIESQKLATALAAFVNLKNWGQPVMPAVITGLFPDAMEPLLDRYEVWRVDFVHSAKFGASVWSPEGEPPTKVYASVTPKIGPPFVRDYHWLNGPVVPPTSPPVDPEESLAVSLPTVNGALGFIAPGADYNAQLAWMVANMGFLESLQMPDEFVVQIKHKPISGLPSGTWGNQFWIGHGNAYFTLAMNEEGTARYRPYIEFTNGNATHAASPIVLPADEWSTIAVRVRTIGSRWDKVSLWINGEKVALDNNDGTEGGTNYNANAISTDTYWNFMCIGNVEAMLGDTPGTWEDSRGSYRDAVFIPAGLDDGQMADLASGDLAPIAAAATLFVGLNGIDDLTNAANPGVGDFVAVGSGADAPETDQEGP